MAKGTPPGPQPPGPQPPGSQGLFRGPDVLRAGVVAFGIFFLGSLVLSIVAAAGGEADASLSENLLIARSLINFAAFFGTVYWTFIRFRGLNWEDLGFKPISPRLAFISVGIGFLTVFVVAQITPALNEALGLDEGETQAEILSRVEYSWLGAITLCLYVGALVPVAEEAFFRGVLFGYLRERLGSVPGILLSALIFAMLHQILTAFIPIVLIGILLAFLYDRFGSIWPSIIVHMTINLLGLVSFFAARSAGAG